MFSQLGQFLAKIAGCSHFTKDTNLKLHRKTFVRFLLAGGVNTLVGFAIYSLLILAGTAVSIALLVGMLLGAAFNFFTTGGYVFRELSLARLPRFILCYLLIYFANLKLIELLLTVLNDKILSQAILVFPMAILSYFLMARFVFSSK